MIGSRSRGLRRERVLASPQHHAGPSETRGPCRSGPSAALPPLDATVGSHDHFDHFDHLDRPTIAMTDRGAADPAAAGVLSDPAPSYD
jgi:L-ascorbate metabolism protein UlaG (beta-lactamase superfamily)